MNGGDDGVGQRLTDADRRTSAIFAELYNDDAALYETIASALYCYPGGYWIDAHGRRQRIPRDNTGAALLKLFRSGDAAGYMDALVASVNSRLLEEANQVARNDG